MWCIEPTNEFWQRWCTRLKKILEKLEAGSAIRIIYLVGCFYFTRRRKVGQALRVMRTCVLLFVEICDHLIPVIAYFCVIVLFIDPVRGEGEILWVRGLSLLLSFVWYVVVFFSCCRCSAVLFSLRRRAYVPGYGGILFRNEISRKKVEYIKIERRKEQDFQNEGGSFHVNSATFFTYGDFDFVGNFFTSLS